MIADFTTEELRMIYRLRHRDRREMLGWTLVLFPFAAFAVYGLAQRDAIAVFVAWAGTAAWLIWWLFASARSSQVLRSILDKYAAAPSADAGPPDRGGGG